MFYKVLLFDLFRIEVNKWLNNVNNSIDLSINIWRNLESFRCRCILLLVFIESISCRLFCLFGGTRHRWNTILLTAHIWPILSIQTIHLRVFSALKVWSVNAIESIANVCSMKRSSLSILRKTSGLLYWDIKVKHSQWGSRFLRLCRKSWSFYHWLFILAF